MKGINNTNKNNAQKFVITKHPVVAGAAALALLATPLAGFGISGIFSNAAELDTSSDLEAQYNMPGGDSESSVVKTPVDLSEGVSKEAKAAETKTIAFNTEGPGHIEPADNCTIDGEGRTITITDTSKDYSFKIVADNENITSEITVGGEKVEAADGKVTVTPDKSDGEVKVVYTDPAAVEAAQKAAEAAEAAEEEAAANTYVAPSAPTQTYTAPAATVPVAQTAPATTTASTPAASANSGTATPASGQAAHSMSGDELACAKDIFNAYNNYRASKGLPTVTWSDDCANMAYASAKACAQRGTLTHRLGIPAAVQGNYSDILQYSSWRMSGSEAVSNWQGSTGHRRMMQCDTATVAAVGAYNNNGVWYYAIVYNFSGTNQSGN